MFILKCLVETELSGQNYNYPDVCEHHSTSRRDTNFQNSYEVLYQHSYAGACTFPYFRSFEGPRRRPRDTVSSRFYTEAEARLRGHYYNSDVCEHYLTSNFIFRSFEGPRRWCRCRREYRVVGDCQCRRRDIVREEVDGCVRV